MTRLIRAWGALEPEQRLAAVAALALLITMFLPWYDLQSLNRRTGAINSHSISAFGDVSFVEAAVFLVAAGVIALMFARAERRDFHMPGSDGAVVMVAGCWAALLIFYRVFSRPAGHGYPVGIQWGFFLAFVAAGTLGLAGWRMRATSVPEAPLLRRRGRPGPGDGRPGPGDRPPGDQDTTEDVTVLTSRPRRGGHSAPVPPDTEHLYPGATPAAEHGEQPSSRPTASPPPTQKDPAGTSRRSPDSGAPSRPSPRGPARTRPRFPPPPSDQLSFEDPPPERDER
jgi:hypothetical protein